MLAEPDRTPYDVNFWLLGFRVRIHPLFWLGTVLLGASTLDLGLLYLVIWVGVVLVSITVHELGHAVAFRRFGSDSHIVLWMFGGLAVPSSGISGRGRRILVSLAGPLAGFILCGVVYASHLATDWGSPRNGLPTAYLYLWLVFVNLYWGIFNLLPVYPLDGGQVSRELCEGKWRGRGVVTSLKISIGTAATVAIYSLACEMERRSRNNIFEFLPDWFPRGSLYTALLFGLLAYQSYQLLQFHSRGYYYEAPDDRVPWEK
ncbi:MAG: site-2 protease family protein [Planctomycetes bacterium]|nr:site-2 protease family protein [Planctomycetota bacterium]